MLLCLASVVLAGSVLVMGITSSSTRSLVDANRLGVIALNLGMLGGACISAGITYRLRFGRPDEGPFLLDSWQSQARAIARLATLPLGALVVALVLPVNANTNLLASVITMLAAVVLFFALPWDAVGGARGSAT
jgi:hypothetical protein